MRLYNTDSVLQFWIRYRKSNYHIAYPKNLFCFLNNYYLSKHQKEIDEPEKENKRFTITHELKSFNTTPKIHVINNSLCSNKITT